MFIFPPAIWRLASFTLIIVGLSNALDALIGAPVPTLRGGLSAAAVGGIIYFLCLWKCGPLQRRADDRK